MRAPGVKERGTACPLRPLEGCKLERGMTIFGVGGAVTPQRFEGRDLDNKAQAGSLSSLSPAALPKGPREVCFPSPNLCFGAVCFVEGRVVSHV